MSKFFKLISVIILSLLTITCDSGSDGGGGGGDGFGSGGGSNSGSNSGFSNDASNNVTGADNEVVCTVKVDSRSFDEDAFISAIADEVGCTVDDIQVTNVEETNLVAYIAFIFISDNANDLLEEIQTQLADGTVGDGEFEAMMIIANMGDDIACTLGEDCADICGGDAMEDACGECNGDSSSCGLDSYVGLYQLQKMTIYNDGDSDTGECSGSIEEEFEGPIFDLNETYDDCEGECPYYGCEYGTFEEELREYVEIKANGEYNYFRFNDNSIDEHTYCWGYCNNEENPDSDDDGVICNCYVFEDDEREFSLTTGTWSVSDEGIMSVNIHTESEWEWGTTSNGGTCWDDDDPTVIESNGCMETYEHHNDGNYGYDYDYYDYYDDHDHDDDYDYYDYYGYNGYNENPFTFFEKTLYGFNIHDIDYDNEYNETEVEECDKLEFTVITTWPTISGCTDPFANNYLPIATVDDGSCNAECENRPRENDRGHNNSRKKHRFSSFR